MKTQILLFTIITISTLFSIGTRASTEWQVKKNGCESMAEIAEIIMSARQRGVSIREIYKHMENLDQESRTFFEIFVTNAYDAPLANNKSDAEIMVLEFADHFFKSCME